VETPPAHQEAAADLLPGYVSPNSVKIPRDARVRDSGLDATLEVNVTLDQVFSWFASLKINDLLSILSAVVAALSFLLSRATVRRQEAMQVETFRNQRDNSLITWANAAIAGIADVQRHCRDLKNGLIEGKEERNLASELRTRLSVLLDSGRLFFPNQPEVEEEDQPTAETAYAGQNHEAIDALYQVYRVISDLGREPGLNAADAVQAVVAQRRRFVSEVFRSIDPRRRDAAFEALTARKLALGVERP
jgi:hypothetical protein